ncbi:hypothetical protein EVAR_69482_1 [Eumeta japonica]|uniref:ATP-dependent DNA helicase n=1 Tax=Eumeta variegata TaxID=151549 RepID=A0A4C1SYT9_EUMVA|nr:hypothetical protein EVAR_69482_1 [Eumeta japonica]
MASDILIRQRRELVSDDLQYDQNIFDEALFELNKVVQLLSSKSINDFGLPMPANTTNSDLTNSAEYTRETSYDQSKLLQNIAQDEPRLNIDQKKVFTTLLSSIDNNEGKIFFLDAPGAVASSGIAATLLEGGRTAHSTFKLPLKIATDDNNSVCSVSKQSNTGKLIRDCSLIVWDEATMSNKTSVEALDRSKSKSMIKFDRETKICIEKYSEIGTESNIRTGTQKETGIGIIELQQNTNREHDLHRNCYVE